MTNNDFKQYLASLYNIDKSDTRLGPVINMAVQSFGGRKPWSWGCKNTTHTTDADGIITFDDDFDGAISFRERTSSAGGWIYNWSAEKFDEALPRLDNLSGSYVKACKVYYEDGVWKAQMAPIVASETIYVMYKSRITSISQIPDKVIPVLAAVAHSLMIRPDQQGYQAALLAAEELIKRAWKEDRLNWAGIFKTYDEYDVREYVRWWGVWAW